MTQGRVVEGVYRRAETMVKLLGFILNAKRNYWRILNKRVAYTFFSTNSFRILFAKAQLISPLRTCLQVR